MVKIVQIKKHLGYQHHHNFILFNKFHSKQNHIIRGFVQGLNILVHNIFKKDKRINIMCLKEFFKSISKGLIIKK